MFIIALVRRPKNVLRLSHQISSRTVIVLLHTRLQCLLGSCLIRLKVHLVSANWVDLLFELRRRDMYLLLVTTCLRRLMMLSIFIGRWNSSTGITGKLFFGRENEAVGNVLFVDLEFLRVSLFFSLLIAAAEETFFFKLLLVSCEALALLVFGGRAIGGSGLWLSWESVRRVGNFFVVDDVPVLHIAVCSSLVIAANARPRLLSFLLGELSPSGPGCQYSIVVFAYGLVWAG